MGGDITNSVTHRLHWLREEGVKSIGFEPTFHFDKEAFAIFDAVANESATDSVTRAKMQVVKRALMASSDQPAFSAIKEVARRMGFNVVNLGSRTVMRAIHKTLWRLFRDQLKRGVGYDIHNGDRLRHELAWLATNAQSEYPYGHLLTSTHPRAIAKKALRTEPQVIFVSAFHVPLLAREMKVPKSRVAWIGSNFSMYHPTDRPTRQKMAPLMRQILDFQRVRKNSERNRKIMRTKRMRKP